MLGRIGWVSRLTKEGSEVTAIKVGLSIDVVLSIEVDVSIGVDDSVHVEETAKVSCTATFWVHNMGNAGHFGSS